MKTKTCTHCGTEFSAHIRSSVKYCSKGCSFAAKIPVEASEQGCLEWLGAIRPDGYGKFGYKKFQTLAHIYAYKRAFGEQSEDAVIRHTCDNRKCVNPDHLRTGTHADNVEDKVSKNRHCFGEGHSNSKLTEQEVTEICDLMKNKTFMQKDIAKLYGVCKHTVYLIKKGKMWRYTGVAPKPANNDRKKVSNEHARKLTKEQALEIRSAINTGVASLARRYRVSVGTVRNIRSGASWKHI